MTLEASDTCKRIIGDLMEYYTVEELLRGIKACCEENEKVCADLKAHGREAQHRYHVNRLTEILRIYEINNKHGV